MVVFYKRFAFWAYIIVIISNLITLITGISGKVQVTNIHLIISATIIVIFSTFIYDEVKKYPLNKK